MAQQNQVKTLCVGRDGRLSGPKLADALMKGIVSMGIDVKSLGMVPTPVLYFATFLTKCGSGVAVTGSHNPPEYNGYKIYDSEGCQLSLEESEKVIALVKEVKDELAVPCLTLEEAGDRIVMLDPSIDDEYAMRVEGEYGKTEAWYILDCDPDAELILGFNREVSVEEFKEAAKSDAMMDICNKIKVKKGDLFFIESGTMHAICKGILLAEVQQNCNTTYRVYDYNRLGKDGKPRELHVQDALNVIVNRTEEEIKQAMSNWNNIKIDGAFSHFSLAFYEKNEYSEETL